MQFFKPGRRIAALLLGLSLFTAPVFAQDMDNPGSYMTSISMKEREVTKTYLSYLSAVSHGKSARKVEKLREKVLKNLFDARMDISGFPPFKGDRTLKDAAVARLKTCYSVFNEDYGKIVNLEEIAEQSYDAMEAYLLAQQKAGEKLQEAGKTEEAVEKAFAATFNVKLIEKEDELSLKMKQSNRVMEYYNKIFLIHFKCRKQDDYLTEAINTGDLNAAEQSRSALLKYATEGLAQLESVQAFDSDLTLVTACKKALLFYKEMCEKKAQDLTDFLLAKENFEKLKKAFDQKPAAQRTQADIDAFNKSVNDINKSGTAFNKVNTLIYKDRTTLNNLWNSAVSVFMDVHIPHA